MGVDTKITLPSFVRVRDVADVIGILLGNRRKLVPLGNGHSYVRVEGVRVRNYGTDTSLVECAEIEIDSVHGPYQAMYHFEWHDAGTRGLMPRSRPDWLAIGKGLVDFFGGTIDYNDCDNQGVDYFQPPRKELIEQSNDQVFQLMQERKMELLPLMSSDVAAMYGHANYKDTYTRWA